MKRVITGAKKTINPALQHIYDFLWSIGIAANSQKQEDWATTESGLHYRYRISTEGSAHFRVYKLRLYLDRELTSGNEFAAIVDAAQQCPDGRVTSVLHGNSGYSSDDYQVNMEFELEMLIDPYEIEVAFRDMWPEKFQKEGKTYLIEFRCDRTTWNALTYSCGVMYEYYIDPDSEDAQEVDEVEKSILEAVQDSIYNCPEYSQYDITIKPDKPWAHVKVKFTVR